MLRRMKTMTQSAELEHDEQAMVEKRRLMYFGIYLLIGLILGLLWFVSAIFGLLAGAWGMSGAVVLWKMQ